LLCWIPCPDALLLLTSFWSAAAIPVFTTNSDFYLPAVEV